MRLFLISAVLLISGCSSSTNEIATKNGFKQQPLQTSKFNLTSYQKIAHTSVVPAKPATEISDRTAHSSDNKTTSQSAHSQSNKDKNSSRTAHSSDNKATAQSAHSQSNKDKNSSRAAHSSDDKAQTANKTIPTVPAHAEPVPGKQSQTHNNKTSSREDIAKSWEDKVFNEGHVHYKNNSALVQVETTVNIYIEGDGRITRNRFQISNDPSPRKATVMKLAALDPSPNVVYLARPCQYSPHDLTTVCEKKHWTSARYSAEIVQALEQAIDQIKQQAGATQINLIGFSGGGGLAVLIAANRTDVASIRTVAGNLDLQTMQAHHHSNPLYESLDPITVAPQVKHIPQIHFVGSKDRIVPLSVSENFCKCAKLSPKQIQVLKGVSHHEGWTKQWPKLLEHVPQVQE